MQQTVMLILRKQIYPAAAPRRSGLNARFVLIIVGLRAAPSFIGGVQTVIASAREQRWRGACRIARIVDRHRHSKRRDSAVKFQALSLVAW